MKKILKALGLLLVAAAMFAGCKKDTEEGPRDLATPLFDKSELTEPAAYVDLKNAKWNIRMTGIGEECESVSYKDGCEITCSINSLGKVDEDADFNFVETLIEEFAGGIPSDIKEECNACGYEINGNTTSVCWELSKAKYTEFYEKYSSLSEADESDPDYIPCCRFADFLKKLNKRDGAAYSYKFDAGTIVTNADKSKYYAEENGGETKWYFSKVQ